MSVKPANPVVNRSHPLARGLVGAWAFEDGGGTTLRDVSGHGLDLSVVNMTPPDWQRGRYGGMLDFDDGTTNEAVSARNLGISGSQPRSISVWFRPDSSVSRQTILAFGATASNAYWALEYNAYWSTSGIGSGGGHAESLNLIVVGADVYLTSIVEVGAWHHVVVVQSGSTSGTIEVFVDGVNRPLVSKSPATTINTTDSPISVGYDGIYNRQPFEGPIADLNIWNRALSANEVRDLYSDPWSLYRSPEPVLAGTPAAGFFEFDQLTGGMPDLSGGMV